MTAWLTAILSCKVLSVGTCRRYQVEWGLTYSEHAISCLSLKLVLGRSNIFFQNYIIDLWRWRRWSIISYQSWVLKGIIIATQHLTRVYLDFKIRECKILGPLVKFSVILPKIEVQLKLWISTQKDKSVSLFRLDGWLLTI